MDFSRVQKVSWFPGHMLKAERQLREKLSAVDLVVELVDARAPLSTQNHRLGKLVEHKPRVVVMGKTDLADVSATTAWRHWFAARSMPAYAIHCQQFRQIPALIELFKETARSDSRCRWGRQLGFQRPLRLAVVGLPNVGKSTLINALVGRKRAKTGPKPGVTRSQQWVLLGEEVELLDTPGIMVPDVVTPQAGLTMALLALVREEVVGPQLMAEYLLHVLTTQNLQEALACYEIVPLPAGIDELLEATGRRLGLMQSGGQVDLSHAAQRLVRDFQSGKLGRITLEIPEPAR